MFYYTNTGVNLVRAKSSREMCGARSQSCDKRSNKWTCAILWANSDNISAKPSICIVIVMKRYEIASTGSHRARYCRAYILLVLLRARARSQPLHETHKILFLSKEKSWEDRNRSGNGRQRRTIYDSKTLLSKAIHAQTRHGEPFHSTTTTRPSRCNRINAYVCVSYFAALVES